MTYTPLKVDLPVCPTCSHVSKIPAGIFSGKGFCSGPKGASHKKIRMEARQFQEVREGGDEEGSS